MIAKNIKGKSFGGCVNYVMGKEHRLLEAEGVLAENAKSIIHGFNIQRLSRDEIKQPVGHIPLSFSPEDRPRMTDEFMLQLAHEYIEEMSISNTQYIIVRHLDTNHDHLHIVYNRIDNDLKLISANNDYKRNVAACKKLKERHNLTFGEGKEKVNRERLKSPDKVKYEIYDTLKSVLPRSHNIDELSENLKVHGVKLHKKYRSGTKIIEGVSFEKEGLKFKGSEIDRKFSYKGLQQLFSALVYLEDKKRREWTPTIKGLKLSVEQWQRLQNGESVRLENLTSKSGKLFSADALLSDDKRTISFSKFEKQDSPQIQSANSNLAPITGSMVSSIGEANSISIQTSQATQQSHHASEHRQNNDLISNIDNVASAIGGLLTPEPNNPQNDDNYDPYLANKPKKKRGLKV